MEEIIEAVTLFSAALQKGRLYKGRLQMTHLFQVDTTPYIFGGLLRDTIKNGATLDKDGRLQITDESLTFTDIDVFFVTDQRISMSRIRKICDILCVIPDLNILKREEITRYSYDDEYIDECMDYCNIPICYRGQNYDLAFNVNKALKFETVFDFSVNCLAMDLERTVISRFDKVSVQDAVTHIQRNILIPIRTNHFRFSGPSNLRIQKLNARGFSLREYVDIQIHFLIDLLCFKLCGFPLPPEIINTIVLNLPHKLGGSFTIAFPLFACFIR